jgi:hypothetical protein
MFETGSPDPQIFAGASTEKSTTGSELAGD